MFKKAILVAFAAVGFGFMAKAQTNLQTFYDFGKDRQYLTTTFEMFKPDKFGDTFFFIDHYYNPFNKNFSRKMLMETVWAALLTVATSRSSVV